jgi:hypothetical protein
MQTVNRQSHVASSSVQTSFNDVSMLCNIFLLRFRIITNTLHSNLKTVFIKLEGIPKDAAIPQLKAVKFSNLLDRGENEIENLMSACEH